MSDLMMADPQLCLRCCPAGAVGKGRLMDRLVADFPDKFGRTVSHTSRRPREHDVHAASYFFASKADMLAAAREAAFLEMAAVATCAGGGSGESYLYGTSYATVREVAATGKLCVMGLDVQGVAALQVGGCHY
jgi:guanylate kinase